MKKSKKKKILKFCWSEQTTKEENDEEEKNESDSEEEEEEEIKTYSDDEEEEEEEMKKKQKQNIKKKEKKLTEDAIVQRENELLKKTKPETENDFERLVLESPNSSYLWIQYMAFKLYLTDIDGARNIGKRALKKINYKEEDEKFNIYSSLINLENKFGDEKTQEKILDEALLHCNKKRVYIQQAQICAKNDQEEVKYQIFQFLLTFY